MREEISLMEFVNRERRERDSAVVADVHQEGDIPPPLPRPEYAAWPGVIGRDDPEIDFYISCKQGDMGKVVAYVEGLQPLKIVRQYGLEQASFGGHPAIVRYLLENGAPLHSCVFARPDSHGRREYPVESTTVFSTLRQSEVLISLLEVFLDAGWHPHQPWLSPQFQDLPTWALQCIPNNKSLVHFFIDRVPDLRLDCGGGIILGALWTWDTEFLDFLVSHGADPISDMPLFSVMQRYPSMMEKAMAKKEAETYQPVPFSQRCRTAEWLLQHGARVNDVKRMRCRDLTFPRKQWDDETALSLACAAGDWEFAEWLLENGADPELLDGRALRELWWAFPYYGKNDASVAKALVEKVRAKHGGKLPAESRTGN